MINASNTLLNRCKLDIIPFHNWRKEPIIKKEAICAPFEQDPRLDKIFGYDASYCVVLKMKLRTIKLGQSLTILFVGEKQKVAILEAIQESRIDNSHYLSLLQVDTDKYRVCCTPKLSIS